MKAKTRVTIIVILFIAVTITFFVTKDILFTTKTSGCPTDINKDGITNEMDLIILKAHFNEKSSFWHANPTDINHDGITNIEDFNLLISNFGKKCK